MDLMNLIHGDCLIELKKIKDKSIDFVYLDLPYNQTACHWDVKLDHSALWVELKRIAKNDRTPFFFSCTTKFGFELFNTAPKGWFRWDLVWEKNRAAGFLNAYRLPMRKHEMIYCFAKNLPDYDVSSHLTGKKIDRHRGNDIYLEEAMGDGLINKTYKVNEVKEPLPSSVLPPQDDHELVYCFAKKTPEYDVSSHNELTHQGKKYDVVYKESIYSGTGAKYQAGKTHKDPLPTSILPPQDDHELVYCFAKKSPDYDVSSHSEFMEQGECYKTTKVYNKTIENGKKIKPKVHKEPLPTSILPPQEDHELVYCFAKKSPEYDVSSHSEFTEHNNTRNKTESNSVTDEITNCKRKTTHKLFKDPLPTSILPPQDIPSSWCKYKLDEGINHRTSKPVKLMEFLLKYWTKEGDTVLDPTAGSGSMGVACMNMNRKCILIEKDADIFAIMTDRLDKHSRGEKVVIKPKKKQKAK